MESDPVTPVRTNHFRISHEDSFNEEMMWGVTKEELKQYYLRKYESDCFDVTDTGLSLLGMPVPLYLKNNKSGDEPYSTVKGLTRILAINHWNNRNRDAKIEFIDIINGVCKCGPVMDFYITFRAKDMHNVKENYEAMFSCTFDDVYTVEFVRYQRRYPNAPGRDDLDTQDSLSRI